MATGLCLARVGLLGAAAEGLLVGAGIVLGRQLNPKPYVLTHLLAGGTLGTGLLTLVAAGRVLGWSTSNPASIALVGLLGVGVAGLVAYGFYVEPRWLTTPEVELRLPQLPNAMDGLRIALLSDVHAGPHFGVGDMDRVVLVTNRLEPDLIALLGDYVARDPTDAQVVAQRVADLRAPLGVVGVVGNHDHWVNVEVVERALCSAGVRVLRNQGFRLTRGDGHLWLAGLDDLRWGRPDPKAALQGAQEGEAAILLAHNPMSVYMAERLGVGLVLSGHTHGGQVRLPLIGALLLPISDRRLSQGLRRIGRTQIYVTRGVGIGTPPARLFARPEVTLVVLRAA